MKENIYNHVRFKRFIKLVVTFLVLTGVAVFMVSDLEIKKCWLRIAVWPFYGVKVGTIMGIIRGGCAIMALFLIVSVPSILYIIKGTVGLYILAVLAMILWVAGGLSCVTGGA